MKPTKSLLRRIELVEDKVKLESLAERRLGNKSLKEMGGNDLAVAYQDLLRRSRPLAQLQKLQRDRYIEELKKLSLEEVEQRYKKLININSLDTTV